LLSHLLHLRIVLQLLNFGIREVLHSCNVRVATLWTDLLGRLKVGRLVIVTLGIVSCCAAMRQSGCDGNSGFHPSRFN
jgi:hypothetical protein